MPNNSFKSKQHQQFYYEMLEKANCDDCYHKAFFYTMGVCSDTRNHIGTLFNFKENRIIPTGLEAGWQTSGSRKVCHLSFNLWNGFTSEGNEKDFTPYELFDCEFAPQFYEAIKLRYPEHCREVASGFTPHDDRGR